MATFRGTAANEQFSPTFVSSTVTIDPAGSFPKDGDDHIRAGAGNDVINSGNGNDVIYGDMDAYSGSGKDRINAGAGDDTIYSNTGNYDNINGGPGYDSVILFGSANVNLNLASKAIEALDSGDGNDNLDGSNQTQSITVTGGEGNDTIRGSAHHDTIYGDVDTYSGSGKDRINAGAGDDTIYSNAGNYNNIIGGAGYDFVTLSGAANVNLNLAYSGIERLESGSGDDNLDGSGQTQPINVTGGEGDDTIRGSTYDDIIMGDVNWYSGSGKDRINAGAGDDHIYSNTGNHNNIMGGAGRDYVSLSGAATVYLDLARTGIERLESGSGNDDLDGSRQTQSTNVMGGEGDDTIRGSVFDDTIYGDIHSYSQGGKDHINAGAGNDKVYAGGGNDTVNGGSGIDSMEGGAGTDTIDYTGTTTRVTIDLAATVATHADGSTETINDFESARGGSASDVLRGSGLANSLAGAAGNDTIYGFSGNDILNGGTGTDTMVGGLGNDTYFVDSFRDVVIDPNITGISGGIDTVQSSISYTQDSTIENLTLGSGGAVNGTGNTLNNVMNGNNGSNVLSSRDGNDTVNGAGGNDTLNGGNGNDTLNGGDGNDTITGGNGVDSLNGGSGADNMSGDNGSDILTGGLGRDVLKGGDGSDRFDFNLVTQSPRGLLRDNVIGFSGAAGQGDKIDLATIDADLTLTGNQAFASGQLSFRSGVLTADVKGGSDLQIQLMGATSFNLAPDVIA